MIRLAAFLLLWPLPGLAQSWMEIERQFATIGISVGHVDGVADAQTQQAILDFQYNFGFAVTGQLTLLEAGFLAQAAQIAAMQTPFVVEEQRTQYSEVEYTFWNGSTHLLARQIYANGPHYLAERGKFQFNPDNMNLRSDFTAPVMKLGAERSAQFRQIATEVANARQDTLATAIIALLDWDNERERIDEGLAAIEVVLRAAEAAPQETGYLAILFQGVARRVGRDDICGDLKIAARAYPLIERIVALAAHSTLPPLSWAHMVHVAAKCAPADKRDAYFQLLLDLAQQVVPAVVLDARLYWARDALARGEADTARQQYVVVADGYLSGQAVKALDYVDVSNGMMHSGDIVAINDLGMTDLALKLGVQRIARIEAVAFESVPESFASSSNYAYFLVDSSSLFIETRQFDNLHRLGVFLSGSQFEPVRGNWTMMPESSAVWEGALIGLKSLREFEEHQRLFDLGAIVMPVLLSEGANTEALEVALMQAEAAVELGAYEDAEPAVVQAVSLAQITGTYARVEPRIAAVRRALSLWQLEDLPAGEKLVRQLDARYATFCGPEVAEQAGYYDFPMIDFEALGDDPEVATILAQAGMLDRILTCGITRAMTDIEARLICALAGFSGRKDVSEFLVNGAFPGVKEWERSSTKEVCAHGLADAGHFDWFRVERPQEQGMSGGQNIRFLSKSPAERQVAVETAPNLTFDTSLFWADIPIEQLEKPLLSPERRKLIEAVRLSFDGGYGRIGPQEDDYYAVSTRATAYRRMGFFRAAETLLYISARVDPFAFGTEPQATLDLELLSLEAVRNRLDYARLYRAEGDADRAFSAIGLLVERAVARLSSDANPLPGTVEQWAKRLEELFTVYLELQFEGLSREPNYPAIFAIQQYLHLANSTASSSVLQQRLNSANPSVAREYQDARRRLRDALDAPDETGSRVADLSLQLRAIEAQFVAADAALKAHQIGVTRDIVSVLGELRAAEAAMLVVTQLPNSVIVMYLDGAGAAVRRLAISRDAAAKMVDRFRENLLSGTDNTFDEASAVRIYDELIGWAHAGRAPPGSLRLVLDGPLTAFPFAALRRSDGWLGAEATLRTAPSVARAAAPLRSGSEFRGFVGLGDPNLTKGDSAPRKALLGNDVYFPELPETARELTFMALSFGGNPVEDVYIGTEASEARFQSLNASGRLEGISVLALATHGLLARNTGSLRSPGLLLSLPEELGMDGILAATEVYSYRIGADLVILSACNTGTADGGEGLSDLASAFLYAGAGSLILTHWEIDSGAGVEIMKRLALDQRENTASDFAESLRRAVNGLLEDADAKKFHHPKYWASHFLLG
jgi:CHAT domain-containing protein